MEVLALAVLVFHLRNDKKWSWRKIGRTTARGIGYLMVGRVIACFLPRV